MFRLKRSARLACQIRDTKKAAEQVKLQVEQQGGYLASHSETYGSFSIDSEFQIRVPAEEFDDLIKALLALASFVESKVIEIRDETAQFVDLTARLKTQKEIEQRYREILKQAKKVEEVLAVEKQLGEIRQEIESKEAQLKLLSHQVQYSTVHLKLSERLPYQQQPRQGFFSSVWEAVRSGWIDFLDFLISFIELWAYWIMLCGIFLLLRRWRRMRRARKQKLAI